ncbi:(Fe-S)-binding protein [Thermodesulfobacteriota bacterium]
MDTHFNIDERLYTAMHKCTRCGQCTYGKEESGFSPLCPMQIKGQFFTFSAGGLMQLARSLYEGKVDFSESIRDILFLCTTCGACEVNCGAISSQIDLITLLKQEMLNSGIPLLEEHRTLCENVLNKKAPYGGSLPDRADWLTEESRESISHEPEIFYFVGCVSSYRETEIPKAVAEMMEKLNIPFTIGSEEWCCGAPLYFSGNEKMLPDIAKHNVEMIEASEVQTAVFTCPTCAMIFKKYYPRWLKKDLNFEILHLSEFLENLEYEGKLELGKMEKDKTAIYHDPCHLGRGLDVYDPPRRIIDNIGGITLKEFSLSRENSFCCGGGGLLPAGTPEFSDDLARRRLADIRDSGAELLISGCPGCKENLKITASSLKSGVKVIDIAELVNGVLR